MTPLHSAVRAACDAVAEAIWRVLAAHGARWDQLGETAREVFRRQACAAIEAADRAAWSTDMEAAPKHATLLDLWCPDSHAYAVRGRYWEQDGQWLEDDTTRVLRPRAWRLLPALPAAPGEQG